MSGRHGMVSVPIPVFSGHEKPCEPVQPLPTRLSRTAGRKNSPISSPNPDSKPTNSRARFSTLNHRGKHGDRKSTDKPIIRPSQENKPEQRPDRNTPLKKIQAHCTKAPATRE